MSEIKGRGSFRYFWVVLLSLLTPGAGQVYAGHWRRGAGVAAISFVLLGLLFWLTRASPPSPAVFLTFAAIGFSSLGFVVWVLVDSIRLIRGVRARLRRPWPRSVSLFVAIFYSVSIARLIWIPSGWRAFSIPSPSNAPTLLVGDVIMADDTLQGRVPHHGDLMVFRIPIKGATFYIKRVIGLPGDRIQIRDGRLFVDNVEVPRTPDGGISYDVADANTGTHILAKEYEELLPGGVRHKILKYSDAPNSAAPTDGNNTPEYLVPSGDVFVLGDNRDDSLDSRYQADFGFVPISGLEGRGSMIYYSWDATRGGTGVFGRLSKVRWERILTPLQ